MKRRFHDAVMRLRKSTRVLRADAVSKQQVDDILRVAGTTPSSSNTQPWWVHVLAGDKKRALSDALLEAFTPNSVPPFAQFPESLPRVFGLRQDDFWCALLQRAGHRPGRLGRAHTPE